MSNKSPTIRAGVSTAKRQFSSPQRSWVSYGWIRISPTFTHLIMTSKSWARNLMWTLYRMSTIPPRSNRSWIGNRRGPFESLESNRRRLIGMRKSLRLSWNNVQKCNKRVIGPIRRRIPSSPRPKWTTCSFRASLCLKTSRNNRSMKLTIDSSGIIITRSLRKWDNHLRITKTVWK